MKKISAGSLIVIALLLGSVLALSLFGCGERQPRWQYFHDYVWRVNVQTGEVQRWNNENGERHWQTVIQPADE